MSILSRLFGRRPELTTVSRQMFKAQFHSVFNGQVNAGSRQLLGVSVITEGPALGHGVLIDAKSLETVKQCAETYTGGLKVKLNHGDGAESIVGKLNNFRIDGIQLRADLSLLRTHREADLIMEMAQEMPDSFGLSISFSGFVEQLNDESPGFVRCLEIYSCDIVDQPAANPTGLFSRIDNNNNPNTKAMTFETPEFLKLVEDNKQLTEDTVSLKAQFDEATTNLSKLTADNATISAQLSEANTKLTEATNAIVELQASAEKTATEHAAALSDFEAKVAAAAQVQLGNAGQAPINLGLSVDGGKSDAELYDAFESAPSIERTRMLQDAKTGPRIRNESQRRHSK